MTIMEAMNAAVCFVGLTGLMAGTAAALAPDRPSVWEDRDQSA